ncbi:hypothetical protein Misp01_25050 [Microtetraspora sp. NBRC 13810]|uniref:hypothetical protein n=1 Tax=Microtetraspora sp. NBRC 13810 TaxID=3030990 RepID=UPI0024A0EDE2|nr:hypothetical protein [Microtetraspora sp. NBRC 13810]GLW07375.1 hypothetical protein Misp01_25050 [Microtetraspora sp. NBRC 13810]
MTYGHETTEHGPAPGGGRRGPSWLVVILVAALAWTGGSVVTYLVVGDDETVTTAPPAAPSPAATSGMNLDVDVCVLLDPEETERLVPQADIDSHTNGDRSTLASYVTGTCTWANRDISYKDVTRMREVSLTVTRHEAIGTTTAARAAVTRYNGALREYEYGAKNSTKEQYSSKVTSFPGIGEQAIGRYQWTRQESRRDAFGQGAARIGNITFEVKYQAGQRHKEAELFSTDTVQNVTEENALREVRNLLTQAAASITAWQGGKPLPYAGKERPMPTPTPTPSPTPVAPPRECLAVKPLAANLVPGAAGRAVGSQEGGVRVTQCQWWDDKLPVKPGTVRWRNLRIESRAFPDADSARYFLIDQRGGLKFNANSEIGGIAWGKVERPGGLGQDAFGFTIEQRTDTAKFGGYHLYVLHGKTVVFLIYGGADRPAETPINAGKATLMDVQEARKGAMSVMRTVVDTLGG